MSTMSKLKKEQQEELLSLFESALDKLSEKKELSGKDGAMTPLIKKLLEASMDAEAEEHVKKNRPNRKNGKSKKQVKTSFGSVEIKTPRDRDGTFEPEILPKRQVKLGGSLENKIINLYAFGLSYRDISAHIAEIYGMDVSAAQITAITDKVWPEIEEWRSRPLDEVYPFVWFDALFYKVKQDGRIKKMAAYLALGMNHEGEKDLLGIYLAETESASFWLGVLSDIQQRGVQDIIIASIDNLKGFKEAIEATYPMTDVQLCIVHQIRNSMRYVPYKDSREVVQDMKLIYKANNLEQAEIELERFEKKWGKKHPAMVKSWKQNWDGLSSFYNYPQEIRHIMYTTNSIEGFNRQIRKATKSKGALPSERALYKLLYLVSQKTINKWSKPRSWTKVITTLTLLYPDRMKL